MFDRVPERPFDANGEVVRDATHVVVGRAQLGSRADYVAPQPVLPDAGDDSDRLLEARSDRPGAEMKRPRFSAGNNGPIRCCSVRQAVHGGECGVQVRDDVARALESDGESDEPVHSVGARKGGCADPGHSS